MIIGLITTSHGFSSSEYKQASFLRRKLPLFPKSSINGREYSSTTHNANNWDPNLRVNVSKYVISDALTVSLVASPNYLMTPDGYEQITLSWTNVTSSNNDNDWIAIYCPSNGTNDNYLDYFNTYGSTEGTKTLTLWNMRCNYEFRYFHQLQTTMHMRTAHTDDNINININVADNTSYELKGISNIVKVNPLEPLQIHLSLQENSPYSMRVMWVSDYVDVPEVQVGIQSYQYTMSFIASSSYGYQSSLMCQTQSEIISQQYYRDPGWIYNGEMSDLKANTTYFYRVGSKTDNIWSREYYFTTGADSKDVENDKQLKFAFFGDMYISDAPGAVRTIQMLSMESDLRFILHIGDLSYAYGRGYIWEQWSNMISDVAKYVPYMISVGNHEYDHIYNSTSSNGEDGSGITGIGYHPSWGNFGDDSYGECGVPTNKRFKMPQNSGGNNDSSSDSDDGYSNGVFWYSFDFDFIHVIMLSSEHNVTDTAVMHKWLEYDLENSVNRTETPWVIIGFHRAIYCTQTLDGQNSTTVHLRQEFEDILYQYKVDAMFSGHFHSYQRTCAVHESKCVGLQNGGTTHVMIGTAGQSLHLEPFDSAGWVEYNQTGLFGWGRVTANRSNMFIEWVSNEDGSVVDSVILNK